MEPGDGDSQGPTHNFIVDPPQRTGRKQGDAPRVDGARGPSAVLVVHGVGQQTKFETLDSLVRGLARTILPAPLDQPRARLVQLAGERLNRVELTFKREGRDSEIHLYEAYWASLTEGRVTLRDVVYLLAQAAVNGVRNGTTHFQRWLFGRLVSFPPQIRTVIALIVGLLTLLSLVLINMTIGVVAAARWGFGTQQSVVGNGLYGDLSTALNLLFALVVLFGAALGLGRFVRHAPNPVRLAAGGVGLVAFGAVLAGTIAVGVALPLLFFLHPQSSAADLPLLPAVLGIRLVDRFNAFVELATAALVLATVVVCGLAFLGRLLKAWWSPAAREGRQGVTLFVVILFAALLVGLGVEIVGLAVPDQGRPAGAGALGRGAVWMLLVAASLEVPRVIVQYVGDLVAYVQPHALDRYQDLRDEIKADVYNKARAVYRAGDELGFTYQRVAIVGHSLGSVVAYDVLNRLIAEDDMAGPKSPAYLNIVKRTSILLTFGSPLDKTAFAFGAQRKQTATRYALAATLQPLIQRPECRPEWVNVHSPWDPISGRLDFYDPPPARNGEPHPKAVRNQQDMDARTLLFAHNEYWSNSLVFDTLLDALDPR